MGYLAMILTSLLLCFGLCRVLPLAAAQTESPTSTQLTTIEITIAGVIGGTVLFVIALIWLCFLYRIHKNNSYVRNIRRRQETRENEQRAFQDNIQSLVDREVQKKLDRGERRQDRAARERLRVIEAEEIVLAIRLSEMETITQQAQHRSTTEQIEDSLPVPLMPRARIGEPPSYSEIAGESCGQSAIGQDQQPLAQSYPWTYQAQQQAPKASSAVFGHLSAWPQFS